MKKILIDSAPEDTGAIIFKEFEKHKKRAISKHTKGPWSVSDLGDMQWVMDSKGRYLAEIVSKDSEGLFIKNPKKRVANAELMSAAPELLAACKLMLRLELSIKVTGRAIKKATSKLIHAIAKAEGRNP